jgi:DNA protecting protein DprA
VQGGAKIAGRVSAEAELLTGKGRAQLQQLSQRGVKIISPSGLPDRLAQAKPLAKWLFVEGDPKAINNRPMVAVVGTRKPSEEGLSATRRIVCMLSEYPIGLVSGLAEGIDATAHRTSVAQHMQNVAFLGHGIDQIFPAATADLRAEIVHCGGAVATEYLPSVHFQKHYFVERNRLQAALADLVLPVEAATNGGTAHTVRFALALGRPIIGIRWKGARGVFEELEKLGHPVIDIDRPEGWRYLDTVLRSLVERAGKPSYPLESFEQRLISEMKYRSIRVDDLQRLHQAVVAALERLGHVPDEQSRDLRLQHTADR